MQDPREAFAEQHSRRYIQEPGLPEAAADDLRFFARLAEQGKAVTIKGLQEWIEEKHGIKAGRDRMKTLCKLAGVEPWFK